MPRPKAQSSPKPEPLADTPDGVLRYLIGGEALEEKNADELFQLLRYVKGIGPRKAQLLVDAGFHTLRDLIYHFPGRHIDARQLIPLAEAPRFLYQPISVRGRVIASRFIPGRKRSWATIALQDESGGILNLVYFDFPESRAKSFKKGDEYLVAGSLGIFKDAIQIVQPPYVDRIDDDRELSQGKMVPLYYIPQDLRKAGIKDKTFREIISLALDRAESELRFPEILPERLVEREGMMPRMTALREMHHPTSPEALQLARRRMKYEEIFFLQLRLAVERRRMRKNAGRVVTFDVSPIVSPLKGAEAGHGMASDILKSLPYTLTGDQNRTLREILDDMAKSNGRSYPMNRLLQGDVGSGKTIVAVMAIAAAIENGFQAALMVPTEILAEQHYHTLSTLFAKSPVKVVQLVGGQPKKAREAILASIASGEAHVVIGTHALIEKGVAFDRLGLVVTDEQHRFGVAQRKALIDKSFENPAEEESPDMFRSNPHATRKRISPDVLIMTATPIPRTLALTLYGDMDVSTIREMPKGRKPIKTMLLFEHDHPRIYEAAQRRIRAGEQVFIVYPLREKSEKSDSEAAERAYETLSSGAFKEFRVGLIHGKLLPQEKQNVMKKFRDREFDVLVSTTVIEVGIDVPNATVMIIEHAERFGLAQLHQLRGRVGRGSADSVCVLVASEKLAEEASGLETSDQIEQRSLALERLKTLVKTSDGFEVAKADMLLRGTGEILGLKQSGRVALHIGNLTTDIDIVEGTLKDAESILDLDPELRLSEHNPTRQEFLKLYRDAASYLHVG